MTQGQKDGLRVAARMLEYPDAGFIAGLPWLVEEARARCGNDSAAGAADMATACEQCAKTLTEMGQAQAAREYVATFDHGSAASLYMSWHRYGNDRSQGRALAALNGLYRTAGFEPVPGVMPDYLPRMLEFLSVAPDWACETLLDGFGAEMAGIKKTLEEMESPYAPLLGAALAPLARVYPELFQPRSGQDPTRRPMARPEPETMVFYPDSTCPGCSAIPKRGSEI